MKRKGEKKKKRKSKKKERREEEEGEEGRKRFEERAEEEERRWGSERERPGCADGKREDSFQISYTQKKSKKIMLDNIKTKY